MLNTETINVFAKDTSDAIVASAQAAASGVYDVSKAYFEMSKASVDRTVAAVHSLGTLKTPDAAVAAHSEFVREVLDNAIADSKTLIELTSKAFVDTVAPLKVRAEAVLELPGKAA